MAAFNEKDLVSDAVVPVNDFVVDPDIHPDVYERDRAAERALTRRLDLRILPVVTVMYFFNSLDRSNYGNAKTDGMTTDLHFPTNGYAVVLSLFYVCFCTCGVPGMIITRKVGAHITMPAFMLGFGSMCMLNAACTGFASSIVVRMLLGVFEAAFSPSLILYLTTFYTRDELARRIACFYSCLALAGAFGGLLAYGVFQIESGILYGWQYLFLIEGGGSVIVAVISYFYLPPSLQRATFLTPEQKAIGLSRLLKDASSELDPAFDAKKFFSPLKEGRFWVFVLIALGYGTASSVASNFLSIIITRFGFSTVKTNLYTVAPNFFSAICMAVSCILSDKFRCRSWYLLSAVCMTLTGCILLACLPVTAHAVGYFACFLIAGGAFTPSVLFTAWHQNNDVQIDSRGFRIAALMFFSNSGGIVSANIFLAKFAPTYKFSLIITAALEGVAIVLIITMRLYWGRINQKRNEEQGVNWTSKDVPTEALAAGPSDPRFRYFL